MPSGIPGVRDLVRQANAQAHWMQQMLEQNARLVGQLPATLKSFNDALERFNQTVARLDRVVGRLESASRSLSEPLERVAGALDPATLRDIPDTLDTLRRETVPALRAATDTQRQVAALQSTVERVSAVLGELPGAGILRRIGRTEGAGGRPRPASGPDPLIEFGPRDDVDPG